MDGQSIQAVHTTTAQVSVITQSALTRKFTWPQVQHSAAYYKLNKDGRRDAAGECRAVKYQY